MFRPFLIPSAHDQTRTRQAVALRTTVISGSVSRVALVEASEVAIAFQGGGRGVCLFYKKEGKLFKCFFTIFKFFKCVLSMYVLTRHIPGTT